MKTPGDSRPRRIHVWVPELVAHPGGIQTFSRFFVRAVAELLPEGEVEVFAMHDAAGEVAVGGEVKVRIRGSGRWARQWRAVAFAGLTAGAALARRPDLILTTHVHFAPLARWIGRVRQVPYIPVAHGIDVWGAGHKPLGGSLRRARQVLAVSRYTRDQLLAGGLPASRVAVQPNTYDADRFTPRPPSEWMRRRFGLQADEPVIATVCRLAGRERYKGYDEILRALPALRRRFPGLRYLLGGSGPDRSRVEALVNELGLQSAVVLAGFIPDEDLPDFYSVADVFAMPSKGEGFGIVFLEAMACGKPVIAGNKDGSADALMDGRLGLLVDPDRPAELEAALASALGRREATGDPGAMSRLSRQVYEAYGYPRFRDRLEANLGLDTRAARGA